MVQGISHITEKTQLIFERINYYALIPPSFLLSCIFSAYGQEVLSLKWKWVHLQILSPPPWLPDLIPSSHSESLLFLREIIVTFHLFNRIYQS